MRHTQASARFDAGRCNVQVVAEADGAFLSLALFVVVRREIAKRNWPRRFVFDLLRRSN
jgi:hypothetical protein